MGCFCGMRRNRGARYGNDLLGFAEEGKRTPYFQFGAQKAFQSGNEHPSQDHGCWPLSRLKPGATAGLDPCGGSGVRAVVLLGQALLLLTGVLALGPHPALALGRGAVVLRGGGLCG